MAEKSGIASIDEIISKIGEYIPIGNISAKKGTKCTRERTFLYGDQEPGKEISIRIKWPDTCPQKTISDKAEIYFNDLKKFADPRIKDYLDKHRENIEYVRARGRQSIHDAKEMWAEGNIYGALNFADDILHDEPDANVDLDISFKNSGITSLEYANERKCFKVTGIVEFYVAQPLLKHVLNPKVQ